MELHKTRINLPTDSRNRLVGLLNKQLADTFDLYSQTKQAHWNVKGKDFFQLHEMFDELAAELLPHVDTIAERATTLGGTALGTARMAASASRIEEYPPDAVDGTGHLEALADRYGSLADALRQAINEAAGLDDADTADLFTEVSRTVDKALWFIEAHLQA